MLQYMNISLFILRPDRYIIFLYPNSAEANMTNYII